MKGVVLVSYGLGGPTIETWETGLRLLVKRCKAAGYETMSSPYEYTAVNVIAEILNNTAPTVPVAVGGASLGDDYAPTIAQRTRRVINYLFGFQNSTWARTQPVPKNVLVADNIYNPYWWQTLGLGSGKWVKASDNNVTVLRNIPIAAPHPGDWGVAQDIVFSQIHKLLTGGQNA